MLVAGAGPAGSCAALDLSRRGLRVALIEQDTYEAPRVGETLPPMIREPLTALGVWQRFLACGPMESYGIRIAWESAASRYQEFLRNPYGCGWHVDRARFDAMLASAAAAAGTELIAPARVAGCRRTTDGEWQCESIRGNTVLRLSGRMLLDATGRKGLLATELGSQAQVADHLIASVVWLGRSEIPQETLIEAVEDGWWYSAPIPGGCMVFAYLTDSDLWRNASWDSLVKQAPLTFSRAGSEAIPPPAQVVSAASFARFPAAGQDWMAIGDAALASDPLSGQGVLQAIETGRRASAAAARYLVGERSAMADYEAWIQEKYTAYLSQRRQFYGSVRRWPDSPFWKRRSSS